MKELLCADQRHSDLLGTQFSSQWNEHDEAFIKRNAINSSGPQGTTATLS